ncbi:MAG: ATP-binding cassette domain-containing protein, partial [Magnetospiraceae bacterium]
MDDAIPALNVQGMTKSFGSHLVLKGIDLTAHTGDVISIIGSSGSGKSTFLRCINLLEMPDAGTVAVHGETISMKPAKLGGQEPAANGNENPTSAPSGTFQTGRGLLN